VIAKCLRARYVAVMESSFAPLLVLCSFPDENEARQIGTLLIEKQLAACVTFVASQSLYLWQGKIESATEVQAHIKTSCSQYPALEALIREHHSYQVPEIIGLPIVEISSLYRDWMSSGLAHAVPMDQ